MEKLDLAAPGVAKALEKRLMDAIDEYCVETYDDGHRKHLGGSEIGEECSRNLWYKFRWVKKEEFSGRMHRLFQRGHLEEERFIEYLEGIGCTVWADDLENNTLVWDDFESTYDVVPSNSVNREHQQPIQTDHPKFERFYREAKSMGVKFPQYRISGVFGHFGGSLDGIVKLPPEWGIEEPLLLEFKTSGTGSPFNNTVKKGMKVEKGKHWAQTCTYGAKYKLRYVLYMMVNKNDDAIHLEVTKLDHNFGNQMEMKAEKIITSQTPPPKISQSASYMRCKWCNFSDICHNNGVADKNCRSCKHAVPAENKAWLCAANNNAQIPEDFIPKGCDAHTSITLIEE